MEEQDYSKSAADLQSLSHTHRIAKNCCNKCVLSSELSQNPQFLSSYTGLSCSVLHCKIYFLIVISCTLLCDYLCDVYYCYTLVSMSDVHIGTSPSSSMNGHAKAKCWDWRTSPVLLLHCLPTQAHNCSQYGIEASVKMIIHRVPPVFFHTQCFPGLRFPHAVYTLC